MKEFKELFDTQVQNQLNLVNMGTYSSMCESLPEDCVPIFSYQIQQLVSEIGEVLESDKRWKNIRNTKYDRDEKLNEIADCFIVLMNVCIFSGFNSDDILLEIEKKLDVFKNRIDEVSTKRSKL